MPILKWLFFLKHSVLLDKCFYQKNNYFFQPLDDLDYVASTGYAQLRAHQSSMYLFQYLHHQGFVDKVLAKCTGSSYPAINSSDLSEILIEIPDFTEQQKIASCLSSIDELIQAQSQKLETLKTHKKGLMQQLFPAEGETVPKLRFEEFWDDGEWEEKVLSEIAELTSSKRVHLADYVPYGIPFFRGKEISLFKKGEIPDDILYISEEHYEDIRNKYDVPKIGDILITAVGTLGNIYCVRNDEKFYFKDGNLIWLKNISIDSLFLEILLDVNKDKVLASAIGSSQKALTMAALNKLEFKIPKTPEQQKIADCLSSLDELIAAQSQKLEMLKVHKKGLMQGLFPNVNKVSPSNSMSLIRI